MNQGLLVLRLVFGLVMAAHGSQKLFGWFRGYGLNGTGGFLESIGFRPGRIFAFAAGSSELAGGLLIALGFLGPVGPALVLAVMLVAAGTVHRGNGLLATNNGIEMPLLYAAVAVAVSFTRFGSISVDAVLGLHWSSALVIGVLLAGLAGGAANLTLRRTAASKPA